VSSVCAEIHGLEAAPLADLFEDRVARVVHPEDRAPVERALARLREEGGDYEVEYRIIRPDGSMRHVVERGEAIRGAGGRIVEQVATVQDITGQKKAEEQLLRARQQADAASRAKSEFLANMSHELRAPLNAIVGFADLMNSEAVAPLPPEHRRFVSHIQRAGDHLLHLIGKILDLSRIESGRMELCMEAVDLAPIVAECRVVVEPMRLERGIQLEDLIAGRPTPAVCGDGLRLKQVLLNLLINAVKYSREGGRVCVRGEAKQGTYKLSVVDSGPGIPPERVAEAFEPFRRLPRKDARVDGSGIGLAVAKGLMDLMHGQIGVEPGETGGSVFSIEVPLAEETVPPPAREAAAGPPPRSRAQPARSPSTVLYVEDEPVNLVLMREIFSRHPSYALLEATSGRSGVSMAKAMRPDIVLMDINLPDMDGFEALAALRADPATRDLPVIAVSAYAMSEDVARGLRAGFAEYITKPIEIDELMRTLDAMPRPSLELEPATARADA
jgi:PAS domain S-box-containing protein